MCRTSRAARRVRGGLTPERGRHARAPGSVPDIRKDLGVAVLPFVIAETGLTGPEEKHPRAFSLMKAQAAVAEYEEFKGTVAVVKTRSFWRDAAVSPSNQGYHWDTNAETYYRIVETMGTAMKELCEKKPAK